MDGPMPAQVGWTWDKYLRGCRDAPGQDLYPNVYRESYLFPLQRKREMEAVMRLARARTPTSLLYIGCDKGGGLYHWLRGQPSLRRVAAVEVRGMPYRAAFEAAFRHVDFCWVEGSSYGVGEYHQVFEWLRGDKFTFSWLDGDKSAFLVDYRLYAPLTSGAVLMHDVTDPAPGEAFRRAGGTTVVRDVSELPLGREPRSDYEHWLVHWNGRSCSFGVIEAAG